jgi:excisionase family DNA binding protein
LFWPLDRQLRSRYFQVMNDVEKRAYRIDEFCSAYGISRSKTYQEIANGRLLAVKIGRMTLIPRGAAERWMKAYEVEAKASGT